MTGLGHTGGRWSNAPTSFALRCYVDPGRGRDRDDRSPRRELWWFLGGFFSGEGYLELRHSSARASIHLRRDDVALLACLARETGVGSIREWQPASGPVNPTAVWLVHRRRDLGRLVEIFDAVGLRGRKRRVCRLAYGCRRAAGGDARGTAPERRHDGRGKAAVGRGPRLSELDWRPADGPGDEAAARAAFAEVLRRAAAEVGGPLTCTAYARLRDKHPHWPTRSTVTITFGSWAEAVRAAGLEDRLSARARHGSAEDH